jgi:hypothetical protein
MRIGNLFWGVLILLLGVFFLLNQQGIITLDSQFWAIFGAGALILLGVLFIIAPLFRRKAKSEPVSIPLDPSITAAEIKIRHGAGRLSLHVLNQPGLLLAGTCVEGAEQDIQRDGQLIKVRLSAPQVWMVGFPPFMNSEGLTWDLGLVPNLPIKLKVETGASENIFDLRDLKVEEVQVDTGASSSSITLPANAGYTRVRINSGAASVRVILPQGVAGRIKVESGLSGVKIDQNRFVRTGKLYETPGFDSAANRAEIHVEMGVGSIEVS